MISHGWRCEDLAAATLLRHFRQGAPAERVESEQCLHGALDARYQVGLWGRRARRDGRTAVSSRSSNTAKGGGVPTGATDLYAT